MRKDHRHSPGVCFLLYFEFWWANRLGEGKSITNGVQL